MTGKEVRGMTDEEIGQELGRLRARLFTLRSQTVTEKVEDNTQFPKVRRDIARLLTERRSREIAGAGTAAGKTAGAPSAKPAAPGRKPAGKAAAKTGAKAG